MPFFMVDDKFCDSKEVLAIPAKRRNAAVGLWTLAGAWSAGKLTDGFVPNEALKWCGATKYLIDCLISANLWETVEGGVQFRNWAKWQRTKNSERQKRFREAASRKPHVSPTQALRKPYAASLDDGTYAAYDDGENTPSSGNDPPVTRYEAVSNAVSNGVPIPNQYLERGELGSKAAVGSRPGLPPPQFCSLHMPAGTNQPCAACGEQRRRYEAETAKQTLAAKREQQAKARAELATRLQAVEACTLCDETGYRGGYPCDHIDRTNTTRNGRAAVNEAMGWT
jgi:hypothetical protein